jgi:multiple sugar transport system substrate-binding protein
MKKVFSLFAVAAMVSLIASGCSSNNGANTNGDQSKPAANTGTGTQQKTESPKEKGKLVYWDKAEYVAAYNDDMKAYVEKWGKDNNIDVSYVIVSPNDLKTKLMAAIEAKNPPDLIVGDDFLLKQFIAMNALAPLDDVIKGADLVPGAKNYTVTDGKYFLAPEAFLMGGAYLRKDVWEKHNLPIPKTWDELYQQAKVINDPKNGFYATGLPLGASGGGDAEGMLRDLILAFGGSIVDKDNNIIVNSPETLAALKFTAQFWQQGLTPTSSTTWDDTGNNNAYLAGTVGFVINSGSIFAAAQKDKPDLAKNTVLIPKLAGPKGKVILGGGNAFAILAGGKGTDSAKKFLSAFYGDKPHYTQLVAKLGGTWQPVLNGAQDDPFWKDPNNKPAGWLDQINNVVGAGNYPGPEDALGAQSKSMQLVTKAEQRIVVEKMDPQKSLDQLEKDLKQLYGK